MPKTLPKITLGELITAQANATLASIRKSVVENGSEPVPEGWHRVERWSQAWKLSPPHTRKILSDGVATGVLERKSFRVPTADNGVRPAAHWRQLKPLTA